MNVHKNARLTYVRRQELVKDIMERGLRPVLGSSFARREPAHGEQVVGSLLGPGRSRAARPLLSAQQQSS